jgi:hypothetical protein
MVDSAVDDFQRHALPYSCTRAHLFRLPPAVGTFAAA